jgi:hypothetical protein
MTEWSFVESSFGWKPTIQQQDMKAKAKSKAIYDAELRETKRCKDTFFMGFDSYTTLSQQSYNNPSHEDGSHTLGPTLM